MIGLVIGAVVVAVLLLAALVIQSRDLDRARRDINVLRNTRFKEERNSILGTIWTEVEVRTLREAAEAWDSIEGRAERKALAWTPNINGRGPVTGTEDMTMVARWLNARADKKEGKS